MHTRTSTHTHTYANTHTPTLPQARKRTHTRRHTFMQIDPLINNKKAKIFGDTPF